MIDIFQLNLVESYGFMLLFSLPVVLFILLILFIKYKSKRYQFVGTFLLYLIFIFSWSYLIADSDKKNITLFFIIPAFLIYLYFLYKKKYKFLTTLLNLGIILVAYTIVFFLLKIS